MSSVKVEDLTSEIVSKLSSAMTQEEAFNSLSVFALKFGIRSPFPFLVARIIEKAAEKGYNALQIRRAADFAIESSKAKKGK